MDQSDHGESKWATIELPDKTYFKIGEVAKLLEVEPYVLRYWETEFDVLEPEKTKSGQRVYQRSDIELLFQIRSLLYEEMFTIAGARRQLSRSRQGKPSYFDLDKSGARPGGTALADDSEVRRQLVETRQELTSAQTELAEVCSELDEMQQEARRWRDEAASLREEVESLQLQLEEAQKSASDEEVNRLQRERSRLRRELVETREQLTLARQGREERRRVRNQKRRERRQRRGRAISSLRREVEALSELAHVEVSSSRR